MPELTLTQALEAAIAHHQAGRLAAAEALYRQILAQHPNQPDAYHLLGSIAGQVGKLDVAESLITRAIALAPEQMMFYTNLAKFNQQAGRTQRAVEIFEQALRHMPNSPDAWYELACALKNHQQIDRALDAFGKALALDPRHVRALNERALLLRSRGRIAEAQRCLEQAIAINPNMFEARGNLGTILEGLGRYAEAIQQYQLALPHAPDHFMLHYNMGVSLGELNRFDEAAAAYRRAIALNPDYVPAYNNLGNVLKFMGRFDEAIQTYHRALALKEDLSQAHSNLAAILESRAEHEEAMRHNRRALALRPDHPQTHSNLCYTTLFLPDYDTAAIAAELRGWNTSFGQPLRPLRRPHANSRDPGRRIRIGFLSPDFRDHVIARNLVPAFRNRDRAATEVFCYSSLTRKDAMTAQFQSMADHWRDVWPVGDADLDAMIRADGIDILVDLTLHMAGSRLPLMARKPAPIQVTFAGYPGSTGLETIDYRLTDPYLDPPAPGTPSLFVEESVHLPSFWCYDPLGIDLPVNPLPALQKGIITFGCLNHFCKVNAGVLDLWITVMQAVPDSRLMLLAAEGSHRQATADLFSRRGIAPERLTFVASRPRDEYLASYHAIDIGLDTLPYNGHTTSLDALWMGVPVVTQVGRTEAGRAGLSQLSNLGMPEFITQSPDEFRQVAMALAADLPRLANYRTQLRPRMEKSILMDGPAFARAIDNAFHDMWQKWCAQPN